MAQTPFDPQHVQRFTLQKASTSVHLNLSEAKQILTEVGKLEIEKLEGLPDGIKIELVRVENLNFSDNSISLTADITILADKFLLPETSSITLNISTNFELIQGKIQFQKPQIHIHLLKEKWQHKLIHPIVDRILKWNDDKISTLVSEKINPLLKNPSRILSNLNIEKLEELQHVWKNADYFIHEWKSTTTQDLLSVNTIISLSSEQLDSDPSESLIVAVRKEALYSVLLEQINKDISSKVDQEVTLLELAFPEKNRLHVKGRAGVMNIKKDFSIITECVLNESTQIIQLKVIEMNVQGGFLVRKAFELVEPKIINIIESSVKISISDLVEKSTLGFKPKNFTNNYSFRINNLHITEISIYEKLEDLFIQISASELSSILEESH